MRNLLELLHEFIMVSMMRTQPPTLVDPESASVHRAIVKAVRDHSPQAAEQAVLSHMDLVAKRLEAAAGAETPDAPRAVGRPKRAARQRSSRAGVCG
jgi:DNA-binding FadR family transcriptional regulator